MHQTRCGILLGYVASDSLVTLRKPQFNTWENWLHHRMTGLLLGYTALDPSRDYELFQLAGVGEISTFFLCFADTFRNIPSPSQTVPGLERVVAGCSLPQFLCGAGRVVVTRVIGTSATATVRGGGCRVLWDLGAAILLGRVVAAA